MTITAEPNTSRSKDSQSTQPTITIQPFGSSKKPSMLTWRTLVIAGKQPVGRYLHSATYLKGEFKYFH